MVGESQRDQDCVGCGFIFPHSRGAHRVEIPFETGFLPLDQFEAWLVAQRIIDQQEGPGPDLAMVVARWAGWE